MQLEKTCISQYSLLASLYLCPFDLRSSIGGLDRHQKRSGTIAGPSSYSGSPDSPDSLSSPDSFNSFGSHDTSDTDSLLSLSVK